MESLASRARSPVYFLDIEGLDPAEQERVCHILGVPVPPDELPSQSEASTSGKVEEMTVNHDSHLNPVEFGQVTTSEGQALGTTDAGLPVAVHAPPHMVPVPVAVVTANPMAAATMATAGMCMVSVPGGIPALPGVPVPGLHPPFVHPDFFRNQPPPSLALNPHVQEFVPGREYIMQMEGGKHVSDMPGQQQQQLPPIFMAAPVPLIPPSFQEMPVPGGGVPGPQGVVQTTVVENVANADADLRNEPSVSANMEALEDESQNFRQSNTQGPLTNGSNPRQTEGGVDSGRSEFSPSAATVSVSDRQDNMDKSVRQPQAAGSCVPTAQSHAATGSSLGTRNITQKPATHAISSHPTPGVSKAPEKFQKPPVLEDPASGVGAANSADAADSGVHGATVLPSPPRTNSDTSSAASFSHTTKHSQNILPTSPGEDSPLTSQSAFPALEVSSTPAAAGLVNGDVTSAKESSGEVRQGSSSVAVTTAKPEGSQQQANEVTTSVPDPPKMSWANLFKGPNAPSKPAVVIYKDDTEKRTSSYVSASSQAPVTTTAEVVSVADDSVGKMLGEFVSTANLIHSSVALQPRGLVNRGNWCYVNATLQALIACPPFYHLFKKLGDLPLLLRAASSTPILDSIVKFISEFNKFERQGNTKRGKVVELLPGQSFEPDYIYKMLQLSKASSSFKHGHQEDAEEFLSYVLDGLHDEMLSAKKHATGSKNGISQVNGFAASPESSTECIAEDDNEESGSEDWQEVGPRNRGAFTRTAAASTIENTPISDMFVGFTRSGILQAAAKERATLQPFFTLQLDIQEDKVASVREALEHFVSKESIQGYTCSKTGEEVEVVKRTTLDKLPPVLILHLKCFVYDQTGGCQKLLKDVKFDVDLQITKDLLSSSAKVKVQPQQRLYKLFAVVFHHGKKATGGHYTTDVFHPGTNGWVHMDDSRILPVAEQDVLNYHPPKMPYLLYYRRRDLTTAAGSS